jgi:hypothetical protein
MRCARKSQVAPGDSPHGTTASRPCVQANVGAGGGNMLDRVPRGPRCHLALHWVGPPDAMVLYNVFTHTYVIGHRGFSGVHCRRFCAVRAMRTIRSGVVALSPVGPRRCPIRTDCRRIEGAAIEAGPASDQFMPGGLSPKRNGLPAYCFRTVHSGGLIRDGGVPSVFTSRCAQSLELFRNPGHERAQRRRRMTTLANRLMVGQLGEHSFERIAVGERSKKFMLPYAKRDPAVSR